MKPQLLCRPDFFQPWVVLLWLGVAGAQAAVITKNDSTTSLNLGSSWAGGVAPGVNDIAQWSTLTVDAARTCVLGAHTTWQGIKMLNPMGMVTINPGNTLTLGAAAIDIDMTGSARSLTLNCPLVLNGDNVWDVGTTATTLAVTGGISGGFSLTKQGSGTGPLVLSGVNTYTGDTILAAGTLKLGATNPFPNGPGKGNLIVSGTLDLNTFSATINGLAGAGTIDNKTAAAVTLTVGANDQTCAFSGAIKNTAGTLALVKTGTGTLDLSGTNSYSGTTTVELGALAVSSAQSGGGAFALGSGTTLSVRRDPNTPSLDTSALTFAGAATVAFHLPNGNPAAALITAGTLTLNGVNAVAIDGSGFVPGRFPLIHYLSRTGTGSFAPTPASLPADMIATVEDNAAASSIDLVITRCFAVASVTLTVTPGTVAAMDTAKNVTLSWTAAGLPAGASYVLTADPPAVFPNGGQAGAASNGTFGVPAVVNGRAGNTVFALRLSDPAAQELAAATATVTSSLNRPNILVFLLDDSGWADFGCYGSAIQTPHIDALAAGGLRYRNFHNTARCSPTRCALMAGNYTHQVVDDPTRVMPKLGTTNNITIPELLGTRGALGTHGYRTYKAGKWHIGSTTGSRPTGRGFEHAFGLGPNADDTGGTVGSGPGFGHWVEPNYYIVSPNNEIPRRAYGPGLTFHCTDAIGDYAVDFVNHGLVTHPDGRPVFAYMPFWAPHWPLSGPAALANKYTDAGDPNPADVDVIRYEDGWDVIRAQVYQRQLAIGAILPGTALSPKTRSEWLASMDNWDIPHDTQNQIVDWNTLGPAERDDLARREAVYAANIEQIDQNIGKVVNRLKELGQFDNTLIFILSDNGANSEGGQFGNGNPATANAASTFTPWATADLPVMGQSWAAYDAVGMSHSKYPLVSQGAAWANVSNCPWRLYKRYEHNGGNLTPMVVSWPVGLADAVKGTWSDQRGHVIDIMATIADITGVKRPASFNGHAVVAEQGVSLKPTFAGGQLPIRDLGFQHADNRAYIRGDWKLVTKDFAFSDGSSPADELELYHLASDPSELNNRALSDPAILARMVDGWNAWALNVGLPNTTPYMLPAFVPAQHQSALLATDLFVDSFNRANNPDTDVLATGMSGSRLPPMGAGNAYSEGWEAKGTGSIAVSNKCLRMSVNGGTSENGLAQNFIGADILSAGGFSVQMRIDDINAFTPDRDCYAGFAVGLSQAQAAGGADLASPGSFRGSATNPGVAACFVELDYFGNVKLWSEGILQASVPMGKNTGTLLAGFATTSFAAGAQVTVTVFLDGQVVDLAPAAPGVTQTFSWLHDQENFLGLGTRTTGPTVSYVKLDNLAIRTYPLASSLAADYALNAGLDASNTSPDADPDGDSDTNLTEWLKGGQPGVSDAGRRLLRVGRTPQGEFRFNHFRLLAAAQYGVTYHFEYSTDLANWHLFTPETMASVPDVPGYELVESRVPAAIASGQPGLFIRLLGTFDGSTPLPAGLAMPSAPMSKPAATPPED